MPRTTKMDKNANLLRCHPPFYTICIFVNIPALPGADFLSVWHNNHWIRNISTRSITLKGSQGPKSNLFFFDRIADFPDVRDFHYFGLFFSSIIGIVLRGIGGGQKDLGRGLESIPYVFTSVALTVTLFKPKMMSGQIVGRTDGITLVPALGRNIFMLCCESTD